MATNNSINNTSNPLASTAVTVDPGSSGDSYVQFNINTTGEFRIGVDDDASDAFKISQGSALGTNDTFVMTADGERTLPLQPSFLASMAAEANFSGDGTTHYVGSITATTEVIDRNGDFTPGDGAGTGAIFTAPVTGLYHITFDMSVDIDGATGGDRYNQQLETSNRGYGISNLPTERRCTNFSGTTGYLNISGGAICDMDTADTCKWRTTSSSGSQTDDIISGYISGGLLG